MGSGNVWIGLDFGVRRTHVCVIDDDGSTLHEQECATSPAKIESAISSFPVSLIDLVAVEAGADTHVVRKLRDAGYPIAMFEARKASRFLAIRRNKTDASDARGLADLGRIGRETVSQVYLKSPECEQLRGILGMRKKLVHMRVVSDGMLRSRLGLYGHRFKATRVAWRAEVDAIVGQIRDEEGIDLANHVGPLVDLCESLRGHLKALQSEIEQQAAANPVCRLLMEVPGVGPICALSFYTAIEDPMRFHRNADVGAYLGLIPRRYQSGEVSRTLGITKTGSKLTRTHLATAAVVFGSSAPDCELKAWYVALRQRVGFKRARVALARKLAILMLTMWKNGTHYEHYPSTVLMDSSTAG